jgi:hypothetical protein
LKIFTKNKNLESKSPPNNKKEKKTDVEVKKDKVKKAKTTSLLGGLLSVDDMKVKIQKKKDPFFFDQKKNI